MKLALSTLALTVLLSACSAEKEPTFGDIIQGQGVEVKKIGEKWSDGEELVTDGNKLVKDGKEDIEDGEKLLKKGKSKVKKGESKIEKGKRLKKEAEDAYKARDVK